MSVFFEGNLYFTGFMASGKSRIGRLIAERLQRDFIDTDQMISEKAGKTVSEIFAELGESAFRKMEVEVVEELSTRKNLVVALGGGALTQAQIPPLLRKSGMLVRLWATPEVLSERIGRRNTRPLLAGLSPEDRLAKITAMLEEREKYYQLADFSVESSNQYPEDHVAERVMAALRLWSTRAVDVCPPSADRYPIFIGTNLSELTGTLLEALRLAPSHEFMICTDANVARFQGRNLAKIREQAGHCKSFKFRPGEVNKSLNSLHQLYTFMLRRGYSRKTCLLQFGGGVVGDMAGFGAATYQRGVPFIQMPTTLLAMVDSSVGGKVAVNHPEGKNMIGAFYQPKAVVCDLAVLDTLPHQEFLAGLAEIVKYGVIYDADFFHWLESNIAGIKAKVPEIMTYMVRRCCEIKAEVVGIDEKETGLRAILNYGHTFGHAIEKVTEYEVFTHGIAVGLGMRVAARLSTLTGRWSQAEEDRQNDLLDALGLPSTFPMDPAEGWKAMGVDKKVEKSKRNYILPLAIGKVEKTSQVSEEQVHAAWAAIAPGVGA
jgi:shikimate kinase / 3-dehydroquinate synthase